MAPGRAARASLPATVLAFCILCSVACLHGDAEPIVGLPDGAPGLVTEAAPPGMDAPVASESGAPCAVGEPLVLYYDNAQVAASANAIDFLFKVANATGAALPLASLAIRYYFTNEITPTWATTVYYAGTCCGDTRSGFDADVKVSVVSIAPTRGADHYLETTFDPSAGDLLDGDSVQVEVAFHAPGFGQNLNQANDYSFVPTATGTQAQWDGCPPQCDRFRSCLLTVYKDGVLAWGAPP
jgi:hypothetical protein